MYPDDGIFKKCDLNPSSCKTKMPGSRDGIASNKTKSLKSHERGELKSKR